MIDMNRIGELNKLGQAIWYDNIRRSLLDSGELQALIDEGVTGVTSNPTIFEKAIAGSEDYDEDLQRFSGEGKAPEDIFWTFAADDMRRTADLLRPVYDRTKGADGYACLEVSPKLAHQTDETISEARHLFALLDRPNVMIKVPATPAGIPAIEKLISEGINVNVTLMFSLEQYEAVANAYIAGLEKLAASGKDPSLVASVASFFVSRVDTAIDKMLEEVGATDLQGKAAIANARMAYARFKELFGGPRWKALAANGARVQRPLWASTGTKNPLYPDTLYVDSLIGRDTVNTLPPATLQSLLEHGAVAPTIEADVDMARELLEQLAKAGVDLDAVTKRLLDEGVASFAHSFDLLIDSITEKQGKLQAGWQQFSATLNSYRTLVDKAMAETTDKRILSRIWAHDHTVWKPEPTEVSNRLGWLNLPEVMKDCIYRMQALADAVRSDGYTHAVLLGMGGSSLAPEVFRKTFGVKRGYLDLAVLDSTDPGAVLAHARRLDPAKTLFIVSTKSGGTVETLSLFKFFYTWVAEDLGVEQAGRHFIAITDPGSGLADLAEQYRFRTTFLNDPTIGGRYSALSYFGLVPAALIGVDVDALLDRAMTMSCNCEGCNCPVDGNNAGGRLGVAMAELAKAGRDKITVITSPPLASFGDWVEQLIAESSGKEGKGILPVVGEPFGKPEVYGGDRLFVYLRLKGDEAHDTAVKALEEAGHPVVRIHLDDIYDLGGQFFLWEMATAVAGSRIGINPFDQPNVEAAKKLAQKMVQMYQDEGKLPEPIPANQSNGIGVYADFKAGSLGEALQGFLSQAQPGDDHGAGRSYVALQAYVEPTPETDEALKNLRVRIRDRYRLAVTVGYGPRFLHSTGQLHKGDAGHGLFIQFTADMPEDAPIPDRPGEKDSSISFGVLKDAQALGDRQALLDAGRKVIRFNLCEDVVGSLKQLAEAVE
jgi:transaldolase/glucose-6-phosphate isomerase